MEDLFSEKSLVLKKAKRKSSHIPGYQVHIMNTLENPFYVGKTGFTGIYSEIPLLRPPKIKTSCLLKTLFSKFYLFVSSFSTPSVPLISDHLWVCPKVVFKTTFGQSQRWS